MLRESHRLGIEPATCKSVLLFNKLIEVQRLTTKPPRNAGIWREAFGRHSCASGQVTPYRVLVSAELKVSTMVRLYRINRSAYKNSETETLVGMEH